MKTNEPEAAPLTWPELDSQPESRTGGDPSDFDMLFTAYWNRLHELLARMVADADEAEDLALEAFCRLHDHLKRKKPLSNPGGWLYRTAIHLGLNALRSNLRRKKYEQAAGNENLQGSDLPDPQRTMELNQEREQVRRILATMKPERARLLILRAQGFSYKELAQTCEVETGSVGTLLNRAEQDFEKRYRERYGEER
jgi:RNA polymerase sigma-70 factor (ECF subfamily)